MPNEMTGTLSRDEQTMLVPAADLLAFLDSQQVTIGPPLRPDGSGWLILTDAGAHVASAWGPDGTVKLERRCATLTEAVEVMRRYEHLLPL